MITDDISRYRLILASRSPRREQLLKELGIQFEVVGSDFDETYPDHLKGAGIAEYLAEKKAESFSGKLKDNEIVITADTIVWCHGRVFGKPVDRKDAMDMIRELAGNTHEVITGVTLLSLTGRTTFSESTKVTFDNLTEKEISYYIDNFRPYDKAGAYGIQEWIGLAACSRIEGSYFNVVGLPVHKLYRELIRMTGYKGK